VPNKLFGKRKLYDPSSKKGDITAGSVMAANVGEAKLASPKIGPDCMV
jgi:hypothetical protein